VPLAEDFEGDDGACGRDVERVFDAVAWDLDHLCSGFRRGSESSGEVQERFRVQGFLTP
jgi:hypothetical protein